MAKNKSEKIIIQVQVKDSGVSAKIDKVTKATKNLSDAEKINLKLTKQLNAEKQRETMLNNQNYVSLQRAKIANMNLAKEKKNLALQTDVATAATIKGKTQTGLNNAILTEAGRTASDAAYGMQGMANNIGQLLTLTSQHIETKGGFFASMKELGKSLFGVGGVLIAAQLLISYLPKIQKHFESAGKKAEKFNKEMKKLKEEVFALETVSLKYLQVLEDSNTSEELRKKTIKELIRIVPTLEEEDFKYGNTLDVVREKIKLYSLAQANRIEVDKLVQANSAELTKFTEINRIKGIKDEEERNKEMRKFLEAEDGWKKNKIVEDSKIIEEIEAMSFLSRKEKLVMMNAASVKEVAKTNEDILSDFNKASSEITVKSTEVLDKITKLTGGFLEGDDDGDAEKKEKKRLADLDRLLKSIEGKENKLNDKLLSQRLQTQRDGYAKQLKELGGFDEATINKKLAFFDAEIVLVKDQEAKKVAAKKQAAQDAIDSYTDDELFDETTIEGLQAKLDHEMDMEIKAETTKYEKLQELAEANQIEQEALLEQHEINKTAIEEKYGGKKVEITNMVERAKLKAITDFISGSAVLFKKGTKEYKTVAATGATIDALASSVSLFKAAAKTPMAVANPAYPYLVGGKALLKGYGTVKKILATTKPSTSGDGDSAAPASIPPSFNIVGSTGTNQLAEAIGGTTQQPIKAFVVSSDVTTAQQLDRRREESASI